MRGQNGFVAVLSFFIFGQFLVQRVYQPHRFIDSCGSKLVSVESEFFRVNQTDDLTLLHDSAGFVDFAQAVYVVYSPIQYCIEIVWLVDHGGQLRLLPG
ncbi:MAG TPA: hypothetical protein VGS79_27050 [Puia sp.]|nr:hypothetical protein [Puia sp.]